MVGFDTPLPDFTDCEFTTPEPDPDWISVVHFGGDVRALDRRMPAFVDALSDDDIDRVIEYVRTFCREPGWPRGDLNFPRPLFTEKAYPENEAVLTTSILAGHPQAIQNDFQYEHRIGRRGQYEVNVPFNLQQDGSRVWSRGLGDVNVAYKHTVFDSLRRGSILSAGGELIFPTGKENEGLGGGVTIFEGFGLYGQALPSDGFLHVQAGFEVPADTNLANKEIFWRTAIGKTWAQNGGSGRAWSPMLEVLGAKELARGHDAEWDLAPQMQVTLSGLQHVMLNAGLRVPVNQRNERGNRVIVYLLWDWFDGGLFSNW